MKLPAGLLAVATALVVSLSACSDDQVPQAKPGTSSAKTAAATSATGPSSDSVDALFEALASNDVAEMTDALELVAPGSVAELYLKHQAAVTQAYLDGGDVEEPDALTEEDGKYTSCYADEEDDCVVWADVEAGGDRVANFTVDGKALDSRLLAGSNKKFNIAGLAEVRLVSAYETAAGALAVVIQVRNIGKSKVAVEAGTSYRSAEGRQSEASGVSGPTSLQPDSLANFGLSFPNGKIGGELRLELYQEEGSYDTGGVTIPVHL